MNVKVHRIVETAGGDDTALLDWYEDLIVHPTVEGIDGLLLHSIITAYTGANIPEAAKDGIVNEGFGLAQSMREGARNEGGNGDKAMPIVVDVIIRKVQENNQERAGGLPGLLGA